MPLGHCMECGQLKPIVKVGLHVLSREADWAPILHDAVCKGSELPIELKDWTLDAECSVCDYFIDVACLERDEHPEIPRHAPMYDGTAKPTPQCLGSGRIIR